MPALPVVGALFLSIAGPAACGAPDAADRAGMDRVRVAVRPFLMFGPLFLADRLGYFADEDIDVELFPLESSSQGVPLLLSGDLDVLPAPVSPAVLNAMARGAEMKFVADKGWADPEGCDFVAFVGRLDAFERREGHGIRGRLRISLASDPQLLFIIDKTLRERFGFDVESDLIEGVKVPDPAEAVALANGTLDGAMISGPSLIAALAIDGVETLGGATDMIPGFQFSTLTYGPRLLREDRELGRRFMVAYLRGVAAFRAGRTPENVAALSEALGLPEEQIEADCWIAFRANGVVDMTTVEDYIAWYRERGWLDDPVDPEDLWDGSFVEHAYEVVRTTQEGEK